eukprot:gene5918-11941_t
MGSGSSVILPENLTVAFATRCLGDGPPGVDRSDLFTSKSSHGVISKKAFLEVVSSEHQSVLLEIFNTFSKNNVMGKDHLLKFCTDFNFSRFLDDHDFHQLLGTNAKITFNDFRIKILKGIADKFVPVPPEDKSVVVDKSVQVFSIEEITTMILLGWRLKKDKAVADGASPPFPKTGVKLRTFVEFIELCGGSDAISGFTTTDVCNKFLKPLTFMRQSSYCELLTEQEHPDVGEASVFISHAWKFTFLEVVQALSNHFGRNSDVIIWFDLFSNNQHITSNLDYNWWSTTFKSAIEKFHHTVLILSPWNDPIPLTRAWCLFEIYCTVDTKSIFEVAMSTSESDMFINELKHNYSSINTMIAKVDLARSEAWNPADRDKIFDSVEKSVGFAGLNTMVFERLREWVRNVTLKAINQVTDEQSELQLKMSLGKIYLDQGDYGEAEALQTECYERRVASLGEDHVDTLKSLSELGNVYHHGGNYQEAADVYQKLLDIRSTVPGGERSPETLDLMHSLAGTYDSLAESLARSCLSIEIETLGETDSRVMNTSMLLAGICKNLGKYSEAEVLFTKCYENKLVELGEGHPITLAALSQLASIYGTQGNYNEAEPLHLKCVELKTIKLGIDHPDTIAEQSNLGSLYFKQGKYEEAAPLFEKCYKSSKGTLGEEHPHTLTYTAWLGVVYKALGRFGEAEPNYIKCYELSVKTMGEEHPDTLNAMNNLAGYYRTTTKTVATRNRSEEVLNALAPCVPELIGGSADLTGSNLTQLRCTGDFQKDTPAGRYFRFGVREHGMAAVCNGMFAHGGVRPFCATFLNFIGYALGAVRVTALSRFGVIYVMTHDSIGPCDGSEVAGAYEQALLHTHTPSVIVLSRQVVPAVAGSSREKVSQGAYILTTTGMNTATADLIIVATGSEIPLAHQTAEMLTNEDNVTVRFVKMIDL